MIVDFTSAARGADCPARLYLRPRFNGATGENAALAAILDHGEIIAQGTPQELIRGLGGEHVIEFAATAMPTDDALLAIPGARRVVPREDRVRLTVDDLASSVPALMEAIRAVGGELTLMNTHHATLEDVFLALTGRELRDE